MIRIVDLFAGAGGESTGIVQAIGGEKYDLAAVNHWDKAIETHRRNHPGARHFQADIQHLNPHEVVDPRQKLDLLWASPECTHHSIARGGRPRSDQSRASAWLALKWLSEVYVRRFYMENVPEFTTWGPLGSDGRPLQSKKGATFEAFLGALKSLGYRVDWQILKAADYGDPTTRRRFYLQAVRGHERIRWPEPTHAEDPGLFGLKPWVPARDIIDWSIRGESIFTRKKPLQPATLRRIEAGIKRYWGEWAEPFLVLLRGTSTVRGINSPIPTITAGGGHIGVVEPIVMPIDHQSTVGMGSPASSPVGTITTKNRYAVVEGFTIGQQSCAAARPVSSPLATVSTAGAISLTEPFLIHYYGNGDAVPVRIPLATITTKDRFALVEGKAGLDITFRMLQPHELAAAQGFPREYWFSGNKTDQVKQIGNAVPVHTARALATAGLGDAA